jgi:hypothetical protein
MVWTKYTLKSDQVYFWHIGNNQFYLILREKEIRISKQEAGVSEKDLHKLMSVGELPNDVQWKSYIVGNSSVIHVQPVMPDRPLVIKTEHDISVMPGKSLTLYARIPVWLGFFVNSVNHGNFLVQDSSVNLSSTWFGPPDNGILSYSLYNPVTLLLENAISNDYEIICPLKILNDSNVSLKLERISLDVDHLKIYSGDIGLCTNEVKIKYKGENSLSDTSFGKQAPSFISNAKILSQERDPDSKNLLRRSFDFLLNSSFN